MDGRGEPRTSDLASAPAGGPVAEVVLDVAGREIDRPFDYFIPPELAGTVAPGWRVRVPFGSRRVEGWVVRCKVKAGVPADRLRAIAGVVAACPPLPGTTLEVAGWLVDRYLCGWREALSLFAPPGLAGEVQVAYRATRRAPGDEVQPPLEGACAEVWARLVARKAPLTRAELRRWGGERAVRAVETLASRGLVLVSEVEPGVRPRLVRHYRLSGAWSEAAAGAATDAGAETQSGRISPARRTALALLAAHPGGVTRRELAAAGVGEGVVRRLVRQGVVAAVDRPVRRAPEDETWEGRPAAVRLTPAQEAAVAAIRAEAAATCPRPVLLHGVTGSGKTEVYLQAVGGALARRRGAIVLVPEIALTPQMAGRFRARFGEEVAVLHSRLGAGERYDEWQRLARGEARVALGARSAVFAPVRNLGLVIVDEEHESSYKQEDSPRYHAREVALARAAAEDAVVVLGSATPAVESYYRATRGEFRLAYLEERPLGRPLPEVDVVDMRAELAAGNREIFSRRLQEAIRQRLAGGEQVILFLNRRGFSRVVLCRACGLVVRCPLCQVALTYHAAENRLVCHYCQHSAAPPTACPSCGSRYIRHFGVGTEKVEEEVRRLFPEAVPVRMDVDTTRRKGAHARILGGFARREFNVLVGTQMIGKGLDLPGVTLVGVVAADTALGLPDFRAAERTFAMLAQVAGRSGRGARPGEVIVQTYNPDHYSVVAASRHDYALFYEREIAFRRLAGYPPFSELVLVTVAGAGEERAREGADRLAQRVRGVAGEAATVLGPSPAPLARLRGLYRFQVLVKGHLDGEQRAALRAAAEEIRGGDENLRVNWDVDPQAML
ncbi:MAG: primosomal protein N' [Bacillota bacterium]|nr:primosomal protein N' [Bacillota bacterium]